MACNVDWNNKQPLKLSTTNFPHKMLVVCGSFGVWWALLHLKHCCVQICLLVFNAKTHTELGWLSHLHVDRSSGVASPKFFWGVKYYDFKRTTLFCLGHRLSKLKRTRYDRNWGEWNGLLAPRLCMWTT